MNDSNLDTNQISCPVERRFSEDSLEKLHPRRPKICLNKGPKKKSSHPYGEASLVVLRALMDDPERKLSYGVIAKNCGTSKRLVEYVSFLYIYDKELRYIPAVLDRKMSVSDARKALLLTMDRGATIILYDPPKAKELVRNDLIHPTV